MQTTTTGHTITVDIETLTLHIAGPTETMDAILDLELDAAAAAAGCIVDWAHGPTSESSYRLMSPTLRIVRMLPSEWDDGSGSLTVIVDAALRDGSLSATASEREARRVIRPIVDAARAERAAERAAERDAS
jgi:hypothetical protein